MPTKVERHKSGCSGDKKGRTHNVFSGAWSHPLEHGGLLGGFCNQSAGLCAEINGTKLNPLSTGQESTSRAQGLTPDTEEPPLLSTHMPRV